jgi:hypothetical protein
MRGAAAPSSVSKLTEAQYLREQAEQAKAAMARALSLVGTNVAHGVNPSPLVRRHPLLSLGAALAGGALAGAMIGRSKPAPPAPPQPPAPEPPAPARQRKRGLLALLVRELAVAVSPIITQSVRSLMAGSPTPGEGSNGHSPELAQRGSEPPPT